jgi:hypothetical protein
MDLQVRAGRRGNRNMLVPWRQNVVKTGRQTTHDPGFAPRNRKLKLFGKCANE